MKSDKKTYQDIYNINNFDYKIDEDIVYSRKKHKTGYLNTAASFDIETTTLLRGKGNLESTAFMYKWMVAIEDRVCFGNYWEEFVDFCNRLQIENGLCSGKRLVMYVHNLAFEFQFMKDYFKIEDSFFRKKRKPLYIYISQGIEFRCSYFLSNMSLEKWCKNTPNVVHGKLSGQLDYSKIRTPKTKLTKEEKEYMINDVLGVAECIEEYKKEYSIANMPLTSTGFVRNDFRKAMSTKKCIKWFKDSELNLEQYLFFKNSFRGGYCHANRFSSFLRFDNVESFDFKSSYPARMLLEEYPYGKMIEEKKPSIEFIKYLKENNYLYVGEFYIENFKIKKDHPCPYIDIAKCFGYGKNTKVDNGRVLSSDSVHIYYTNVDIEILKDIYELEKDSIKPVKIYYCRKKPLPIEYRATILHYYALKCQLPKDSYEYMKSKNKLNASFGMAVTDIISDSYSYTDNEYKVLNDDPEKKLKSYYENRNSFLPYQIGVFITAYARKELFKFINYCNTGFIYCDTDSIKFKSDHIKRMEEFRNKYNENIKKQFESYDLKIPYSKDGYLGYADIDDHYDSFMTLGAKKYAYNKDGKFHITVSGIPKKEGAEVIQNLENFSRLGYTYKNIGKNKVIYNDVNKIFEMDINGEKFSCASNIALVPGEYTMGISKSYFSCLEEIYGEEFIKTFLFFIDN